MSTVTATGPGAPAGAPARGDAASGGAPLGGAVPGDAVEGGAAGGGGADAGRRRRWRRDAWLLAVVGVLLVLTVLGVVTLAGGTTDPLDPRSAAPDGSRAVARVLEGQGVDVRPVERVDEVVAAAGPGTTVVVVERGIPLPEDRLADLAGSGADVVLLAPGFLTLLALAPDLVQAGPVDGEDDVAPACDDPDAVAAGEVGGGGQGYVTGEAGTGGDGTGGGTGGAGGSVTLCYRGTGEDPPAPFAVVEGGAGRVTAVGNTAILTNERLDEDGNAALALRALGRQPVLLWYLPDPFDPALTPDAGAEDTPTSLLPSWVRWVALQLLVVALVAIAWRARRFGALVPERLPAVVRSAETAEGRARLYRRAGARDRAAALLRAEASGRLAARLGARRGATALDVSRLAASATGRDPRALAELLAGQPPTTDAALVALADDLDDLVRALERA